MNTEWTAERLDALPEGTVIEWLEDGGHSGYRAFSVQDGDSPCWVWTDGDFSLSWAITLSADLGSIRVVSVPIDALLADETVERVARSLTDDWNPDRDPVLTAMFRDYAQTAASAVVAHITGEATP